MSLDIPDCHSPGIHRYYLVVKTTKPVLAFFDYLRLKTSVPVPRCFYFNDPLFRLEFLGAAAIACIIADLFTVLIIPKMICQLTLHRFFKQPLLQLLENPAL